MHTPPRTERVSTESSGGQLKLSHTRIVSNGLGPFNECLHPGSGTSSVRLLIISRQCALVWSAGLRARLSLTRHSHMGSYGLGQACLNRLRRLPMLRPFIRRCTNCCCTSCCFYRCPSIIRMSVSNSCLLCAHTGSAIVRA